MDACELGDCGASYDTHRPNKLPPENVSFMMVVGFCTPCLWRAETRDEQNRRVYPTREFRVPPQIFVWFFPTFGNNFGIDEDFTKYLNENCW